MGPLSIGQRDIELKYVLAAQNKLHPALFSKDAEHKVVKFTFFITRLYKNNSSLDVCAWNQMLISSCCINFRFCNI